MTCDEVREHLPDHVLGTLSELEDAAVRRHLRGCAACREEARTLDEGIAMFGSAAHAQQPPKDLRQRVVDVLEEEWSETPAPRRLRWRVLTGWQGMAAALVVIAGLLAWGIVGQAVASRSSEDAQSYRAFLSALGGKDVRVASLVARTSVTIDGNAILYDSDEGQSWIMLLARAPGYDQKLTVEVRGGAGKTIKVPFPLQFASDGDGWTGMVTTTDLTPFTRVILRAPDGSVVADGLVPPG